MRKCVSVTSVTVFLALFAFTLITTTAAAHEKRHVGNYTFVVGFLDEPAYAQVKNSLDLTICNGADCNYTVQDGARILANPVNDADKTLKVEVSQGGHVPLALTLEPRWANPGKYNAYFLPTTTGDYTFHIFGTLNGTNIDERFTSSPTGFSPVEAVKTYPATTDQTGADIASLKSQVADAQNSTHTSTTFGIAGTVLGALGVIVAGVALARKPRLVTEAAETKRTPVESLRG